MSELHDANLLGVEDAASQSTATPALERVVTEAPPEYESVMASIPLLPGWVRLLALIGAPAVLWAAIFIAAKMLFR